MNRNYRLHPLLAFVFILSVLPMSVAAQCSLGAANDDLATGIRTFGWKVFTMTADTLLIEAGNSFLIDCDAHLQTIEATIDLGWFTDDSIEPLLAGDLVRCEVFDGSRNLVMTEIVAAPDPGVGELEVALAFDFSDRPFRLAAGTYYYLLAPVERRWGTMRLGTEYADGEYLQELLGNWSLQSGDAMLNITWDPNSSLVAAKQIRWGALKAHYR
jgi:hypothetical protein